MKKYIISGLIGLVAAVVILAIALNREELSGTPDAISSYNFNGDLQLCVIVNERNIEDKEALAREIIDMCRNNSFHTIKFSYDVEYPASLSVSVYETRRDFENGKELCEIVYDTENYKSDYNIVENPEKYHLYVDEEKLYY